MTEHVEHNNMALVLDGREEFPPSYGGKIRLTSDITRDVGLKTFLMRETIANVSPVPLRVNRALSSFTLRLQQPGVFVMESSWCRENREVEIPKPKTETVLCSFGGRTTKDYCPYVRFQGKNGECVSFHVLPVGDWIIRLWMEEDRVVILAGLKDEGLDMILAPGEAVILPGVIVHAGDSFSFQRFLMDHTVRKSGKTIPVVYNSWFYAFDCFNMAQMTRQAENARRAGVEVFVVDAGWYGNGKGDWSEQTGDWSESLRHGFKGRMKEFAGYVRDLGMGFGLWMEPERVCGGVPVQKQHPGWFIATGDGRYYPDLGNPAAWRYLKDTIQGVIREYQLDWFKWDFNFEMADDPRHSNFFIHHTRLYAMLDELHREHPGVVFEGCASGGLRHDGESLSHFDAQFLSDNTNPADMIGIYKGLGKRLACSRTMTWSCLRPMKGKIPRYGKSLENSPATYITPSGNGATWDTYASVLLAFSLRTALLGIPGLSGDMGGMPEVALKEIGRHFNFYRLHAGVLQDSLTLCLGEGKGDWEAFQRISPDASFGLVLVFSLASGNESCMIKPEQLDESGYYRVSCFDDMPGCKSSGKKLMEEGISVFLSGPFQARMLVLEKMKGTIEP